MGHVFAKIKLSNPTQTNFEAVEVNARVKPLKLQT